MRKNKHGLPIMPTREPPRPMTDRESRHEINRLRGVIFAKCDGRCYYCGEPLALHDSTLYNYMTVDHYIPQRSGGATRLSNLVPACAKCNRAKANMHPRDFRTLAGPFYGERSVE